ncbi:hypothetical protein [Amycolatopsis sp. H20-H5]|uniref:hypothetical protein n=1 Tax=Amycolatopsis sp. H20-H5 TaxID=3046309 RepID=UPI002DBA1B3E|nr:hypothetical protein [Amycolatopsis sp. H20-H5]MEC3978725.1 hypothetical protein [Amycolatopsis sp. H20-H5]
MSDDSGVRRSRRDCVVERVETVPMTAEQYEQAVNALATLIVEWTTGLRGHSGMTPGHPEAD